ncbi:stage III sporulation protein AA [Ruminiclostridium cellulolyticum]|uniref:Stage III sporulation protein AA n=1 Tax=Ruminiclostridium cellulolyticum (strain ATCC 35319 / DSM 5812 / JCM 6584 / H10) TaxID=394503 RepID=B8I3C1_RUMCH|nr:stage III sporulation protein AA [Ruminiclostridium cellulolyticum]ACL76264.1 stage III sporulation protein AA [Ruminiclostridium cellulolyticum H10]
MTTAQFFESKSIKGEILPFLIPGIRAVIQNINVNELNNLEEIRLRAGKPLMVFYKRNDWFVAENGRLSRSLSEAYMVDQKEIVKTLELMSENSIYAYQDEIKSGYLTLRGGHRIGLSGRVVLQEGKIRNIKDFNGINIRIAREVKGCANHIIKYIIKNNSDTYNTLIVGPPQCGKTTILRDLSRMLSSGETEYGFSGMKVGIVDERSEIAACCKGVPQSDVGYRTDVMDGCPKALGMEMLLRSMSPEIIITDEIGTHGDKEAILKVLNSGIKIIASAHGYNITELKMREELLSLIKSAAFERYIVLSSRNGPGTLEEVVDAGMTPIYRLLS